MAVSSSLFLFIGPNTYAMREEKRRWKEQFVAKHGEENLLVLQSSGLQFRALADEVGAAPFIGEKRLVCVEGMPRFEKEEIESLPNVMHPSTILVVSDPQPDKRLGATKALLKIATVKEFAPLEGAALRAWLRESLRARGVSLDATGEELLLTLVGSEQEVLSTEIEKLSSSPRKSSLTAEDIRMLVVPWGEQEIWHLTNLLARGDSTGALRYAAVMLKQGEDAFSLWAMLLWMLRNFVIVATASAEGVAQAPALASRFGVPFPTAKTLVPAVRAVRPDALRDLIRWASDADIGLKTGLYRATSEGTEELVALIEQLIVRTTGVIKGTTAAA